MRWLAFIMAAACLPGCTMATRPMAAPAIAGGSALAGPGDCGDFLAATDRKPAGLVYVGCTYQPERQGRPLWATYRMEGRAAAAVEAGLMQSIGLEPLRWACCGWDAPPRGIADAAGRRYVVAMGSGETIHNRRADWGMIDTFTVDVTTFTEEI